MPARRQPVHQRGNRISGVGRLNEKGIKVLGAIKFAPESQSREDIVDKTSLSPTDVEHQVKLLLGTHLIEPHLRFPRFPTTGWRVFTSSDNHHQIINMLKEHGIVHPWVPKTKELLGSYYDVCSQPDYYTGRGRQPNRGHTYIKGHPIVPEINFSPEEVVVIKKFRDEIHPFKPKEYSEQGVEEKKTKWKWFVKEMSNVYQLPEPIVRFGIFSRDSWSRRGSSAYDDQGMSSSWSPGTNTLYITGRFSLVTLLHEFGHVRGFDERDTTIWSINIGYRHWPKTFHNLLMSSQEGTHMMTQSTGQYVDDSSEE